MRTIDNSHKLQKIFEDIISTENEKDDYIDSHSGDSQDDLFNKPDDAEKQPQNNNDFSSYIQTLTSKDTTHKTEDAINILLQCIKNGGDMSFTKMRQEAVNVKKDAQKLAKGNTQSFKDFTDMFIKWLDEHKNSGNDNDSETKDSQNSNTAHDGTSGNADDDDLGELK